jgi:polyisoprenoid-binding protein YceI
MTVTVTRPAIEAGTYRIDPRRTTVTFTMREWYGLLGVTGTFAVRHGTIVVAAEPTASSVHVALDPASFRTDRKKRDEDIRGRRWLDVATYPDMEFRGTRVTTDAEGWRVDGRLTVHGVSAPVTLRMVDGAQRPDGCAFTATCTIDRLDFGVTTAPRFVGTKLEVRIEVYAARTS